MVWERWSDDSHLVVSLCFTMGEAVNHQTDTSCLRNLTWNKAVSFFSQTHIYLNEACHLRNMMFHPHEEWIWVKWVLPKQVDVEVATSCLLFVLPHPLISFFFFAPALPSHSVQCWVKTTISLGCTLVAVLHDIPILVTCTTSLQGLWYFVLCCYERCDVV